MTALRMVAVFCLTLSGPGLAADPAQLVDVQAIHPRIQVALVYATADNFLGKAVYSSNKCYLRRVVAEQLAEVQGELEKQGLGLKVWDGYRPLSVQKRLWELVPDSRYVANPANGSRHNRGAAVDVTLVDANGRELEMPTRFDDFTAKAGAYFKEHTPVALKNRKILQEAMLAHRFEILPTEWWHFDSANWRKFPVMDISVESLAQENPKP